MEGISGGVKGGGWMWRDERIGNQANACKKGDLRVATPDMGRNVTVP